jgi:hypothetical protein
MNNKWLLFFLMNVILCLIGLRSNAQLHFIYIQSDNKAAFTVKLSTNIYSSSADGSLMISKLKPGKYNLAVNAPSLNVTEVFTVKVADKDLGFALKNKDNKGWVLENQENFEVLTANKPKAIQTDKQPVAAQPNNSAFASMLSLAVGDPDLTKPLPNIKIERPVTAASTQQENDIAKDNEAKQDSGNNIAIDEQALIDATARVFKDKTVADEKGTNISFVIVENNISDTVDVFIPSDSFNVATKQAEVAPQKDTGNVLTNESTPVKQNTDSATNGNPFYAGSKQPSGNVDTKATVVASGAVVSANKSNCTKMLSESEIDKIRRKMFVESSDDKMIEIAKKSVKDKCITVQQVENLATQFLSDEGRFNLFVAMQPRISNMDDFSSLKKMLVDPSFKQKFDALSN